MKKVQVKSLRKGDVLSSTKAVVLEDPYISIRTRRDKLIVKLEEPDGRRHVVQWGKYTQVGIDEREGLKLMQWAELGFPPINLQEEVSAILDLIHEIRALREKNNLTPKQMVTKDEMESWIKDCVWVVYAMDTRYLKKMYVAVGSQGFRVTHGKEIMYEGNNMQHAIVMYNSIIKAPDEKHAPKTDN